MVEDEIIFQTDIIIAEATERVTKELSEKYNNDPNAEVSEEDILKYMNKVIESLPQQ